MKSHVVFFDRFTRGSNEDAEWCSGRSLQNLHIDDILTIDVLFAQEERLFCIILQLFGATAFGFILSSVWTPGTLEILLPAATNARNGIYEGARAHTHTHPHPHPHAHAHSHAIGRDIPEVTSLLESANPRANETNKRVNEIKAHKPRFCLTGDRSAAILRLCCVHGVLLCIHSKQAACTGVVRWPAYSAALEESS